MFLKRLALAGVIAGVGLGTTGCTDGYGYSGLDVGYGVSDYDGYGYGYGYGDPYYGGYGSSSYFGWYGDFYYPGSGAYVYDRYRRPFRWNGDQQRYWQARRGYRGSAGANWNGFARNRDGYRGGQQGYRGQPYVAGRPSGGTPGSPGGYRHRGYQGTYNGGVATPNAGRVNRGADARSFGSGVAPSGGNRPAGQGGWRGGGGRHGRR